MVPKLILARPKRNMSFRAVLFRMVPKQLPLPLFPSGCFRAVLFRMVPKRGRGSGKSSNGFRAVLFRMVPKLNGKLKVVV